MHNLLISQTNAYHALPIDALSFVKQLTWLLDMFNNQTASFLYRTSFLCTFSRVATFSIISRSVTTGQY